MRTPDSLVSLVDEGIIDEVVRPLMSGKEAQVYLVSSGSGLRVAKVYKDAQQRSFKQRADYTEGRTVRNSRDQRAMQKRTRYGREQDEAAWRSAEVDMIYRLRSAGVRVPVPYHFIDGVLIMELVTDAQGNPAPRLGDLQLDPDRASRVFERLIQEVVRMLAAGVVHGDLSDFNVLMGADGPVIIDFPQSIDASNNQNARKLLLRDVDNLHRFLARFVPGRRPPPLAQEMWQLFERGELTAETQLTGRYRAPERKAATEEVLSLVAEAAADERERRQGLSGHGRSGQSRQGYQAQGHQGQGSQAQGHQGQGSQGQGQRGQALGNRQAQGQASGNRQGQALGSRQGQGNWQGQAQGAGAERPARGGFTSAPHTPPSTSPRPLASGNSPVRPQIIEISNLGHTYGQQRPRHLAQERAQEPRPARSGNAPAAATGGGTTGVVGAGVPATGAGGEAPRKRRRNRRRRGSSGSGSAPVEGV